VTLILASASPRRSELLTALGFDFEVEPSNVDEEAFGGGCPAALARRIARAKAAEVAARRPDAKILAADTIVVLGGAVLNKPRDAAEARDMLLRLRGRRHRVITAVCLARGGRLRVQHAVTRVWMRPYRDDEIEASIQRGEPFDKAGGYAIQEPLFAPVAAYKGCYCNVVGLPLGITLGLLREAGTEPVSTLNLPDACYECLTKPQGGSPAHLTRV
jgi:MAF protein